MLSGLTKALAGDGGRLSLLSRQASAFPGVDGYDCDYDDAADFQRALDAATDRSGPVELAVAWFHSLKLRAPRLLAERVSGRMFQVLGSATADPSQPRAAGFRPGPGGGPSRLRPAPGGARVRGRGRPVPLADP
jgi:hypothetical protein